MTSSTQNRGAAASDHPTDEAMATAKAVVADAGERVSGAIDVVRSTADQVGDRLPDVIDTVRGGAVEGTRTIQAMPDATQRLLAAFSLGLGVGLSVAGAPRLVVLATLAPAMVVAGTMLAREPKGKRAD